jgi:hypothetical protein
MSKILSEGNLQFDFSGFEIVERFHAFTEIQFDLVNAEELKKYGITCTTIN